MDLKRQLDDERPDVVMMNTRLDMTGMAHRHFSFIENAFLRRCGKAVWKGRIHEAVEPLEK